MLKAETLGQLLLMQNVICGLPNVKSIFLFVCKGLLDVPGILAVRRIEPGLSVRCVGGEEHLHIVAGMANFGALEFKISDPLLFQLYRPYLSNLCVMIAVILEERRLRVAQLDQSIQSLKESERRLKLASSSAKLGIWEWDTATGQLNWDERMFEIYGLEGKSRSIDYQTWKATLHLEDMERVIEATNAALRGEGEYDSEFRIVKPDGSISYVKANGIVIKDSSGKALRMVGLNRDITEQIVMAERIHQSEKMDAIGQLAGGVAHDFNNQLSGIMGYAELLVNKLDDPVLKRYASQIMMSSSRAADLTKNLLAFSRKGRYFTSLIDVHSIIGEVIDLLQRSIDRRIEVQQHFEAEQCCTLGDPTQIQNALLNLAINARDAMPDGGELSFSTSTVEIAKRSRELDIPAGRYLLIGVSDTGVGMTAEVKRRLFEPFFSTKKPGKGTGLGLAAVYGTVKSHRGAITVYSEIGHGTTFKIYLPIREQTVVVEPKLPISQELVSGAAQILLVDDEEIVRELASEMLRGLGYRVTVCNDGEAALGYFSQNFSGIDLVILDLIMPKMGGRETFFAMQKISPGIRTILASGYSMNREVQGLLDAGVLGFIQKPFQISELARKVADALQMHR